MRRGVLGGTFDPVHLGHLVLAERAREQLALDRVLWVPAGDPWRKAETSVTAAEHRLAMVRLAIDDNPAFQLCTLEVDRPGPTYTVDTLAALREEYPDGELVFLLGMDALEDLPNWHQPDRLIRLAMLAVAPRAEDSSLGAALERALPRTVPLTRARSRRPGRAALDRLLPGLGRRVLWLEMPRIDISATELRRWAAAGRSLRYLVPDAVEAYIRQRGLYRSE